MDLFYGQLAKLATKKKRRIRVSIYLSSRQLPSSEESWGEVAEGDFFLDSDDDDVKDEPLLRTAIYEKHLRWNSDYCLAQNLHRFKSKLMTMDGTFWKWASYEAYLRRSNTYDAEYHAGLEKIQKMNWRAPEVTDITRFFWHNDEFAPYSDSAAKLVLEFKRRLDHKFPIKQSNSMSRSVYLDRDRRLFSLFHDFLTMDVHLDDETVVPITTSFQTHVQNLAAQDSHPGLVYAASKALSDADDVLAVCAVPRHLPGMWTACCSGLRVPWYSNLEALPLDSS